MIRLAITLIISLATILHAEVYTAYVPEVDDCHNFGVDPDTLGNDVIRVNYVNLKYDSENNLFSLEVEVDDSRGELANVLQFVLTPDGIEPSEAQVAHLYLDGTDINTPRYSIYAYNAQASNDIACNNSDGSWQHADFSSNFPADTIQTYHSTAADEISIVESTNGGTTVRTYTLTLDTAALNSYTPAMFGVGTYPYGFDGIQFGEKIGIWFWAAGNATTTYDANGFLTAFNTTNCAVCDQEGIDTEVVHSCQGTSVTANPIEAGSKTDIVVTVNNPDCNDSDPAPIKVNYMNLPAGVSTDVAEDGTVTFGADCTGQVVISWTPLNSDAGTYEDISVKFTKDDGINQDLVNCAVDALVVVEDNPECKQADTSPITQADEDLERMRQINKSLVNRIKKLKKKLGLRPRVDRESHNALYTSGWNAYNAIIGQGTYLFECTKTELCTGSVATINLSNEVSNFEAAINDLHSLTLQRVKKYRKFLVRKLIEDKGLSTKQARRVAKKRANRLFLEGRNSDGANPSAESANSLVELHVNTYGLQRFTCENADVV